MAKHRNPNHRKFNHQTHPLGYIDDKSIYNEVFERYKDGVRMIADQPLEES
jgi:hypothetical protein